MTSIDLLRQHETLKARLGKVLFARVAGEHDVPVRLSHYELRSIAPSGDAAAFDVYTREAASKSSPREFLDLVVLDEAELAIVFTTELADTAA